MFTIYKATNKLTGKSYIGFDCNWPYRKSAHKCAARMGESSLVFHNAIRKYGWNNFVWSVVEQSEDRFLMLTEREEHYIRKFNTHFRDGSGYNMTYGGEGTLGKVVSEETKKRISDAKKGKPAWNKGKPSPWTAERNRKTIGIPKPHLYKKYRIIDPEGNESEIEGITKFCEENGLNAGNMVSVSKGKLKQYKGWKCFLIA